MPFFEKSRRRRKSGHLERTPEALRLVSGLLGPSTVTQVALAGHGREHPLLSRPSQAAAHIPPIDPSVARASLGCWFASVALGDPQGLFQAMLSARTRPPEMPFCLRGPMPESVLVPAPKRGKRLAHRHSWRLVQNVAST